MSEKEYNGYKIVRGLGNSVFIKNTGQGPVHASLAGVFTSTSYAQHAIDTHLASKEKGRAKAVSNG